MIIKFLSFLPVILLVVSVTVLTPILYKFNYYWDYFLSPEQHNELFDFIIVGSGSAGAVVANRLSKNNKILVLEAGGDPTYFAAIPMVVADFLFLPEFDWGYKTVPQKFSMQGMNDKVSPWPRGKVLGGTSNLNYMLYARGNKLDYDNWANITSDDSWSYDNLLPYFKRSLDYHGTFSKDGKHYGNNPYGTLHVEKKREDAPLYPYFIDAVKELGYKELDINGNQQVGFGPMEVTQKRGRRSGTWNAFLKDIQHRKNLVISRYSHVTKIKLSLNNHRAEGVYYMRHGKRHYARASKEILICGGAVDSPKLLMLSGIGPKKHLNEMKIKPKLDLPVGQNLKDHINAYLIPFLINTTISTVVTRDIGIHSLYDYFVNGHGPLASPGLLHSHGFVPSKYVDRKDWPDLQVYFAGLGVYPTFAADLSRMFGYNETLYSEYLSPLVGQELDAFVLAVTLVRPKSVGDIKLKDKNWPSHPVIDPRYLEDESDVKALVDGVKFVLKIAEETKSFKRLDAKFPHLPNFPGCEKFPWRSDSYWECFIRYTAFTLYHPVGTCRMGSAGDQNSVVDSKLIVKGTPNLRVIDLSIAPEIVNANTNAAAIMIGEKGVDLVREYWSRQYLVSNWLDYIMRGKTVQNQCYYSKIV